MQLTIKQNSPNQSIRFFLVDEAGQPKTGLDDRADGLVVAGLRENDPKPTAMALRPWGEEAHIPAGFREIDPLNMPGLYELGLPDAFCQEGAHRATLMVRSPGVRPLVVHIDLIAYDPYDGYRLGLDCLTRESRHEVIARAFREVVPDIVQEFRSGLDLQGEKG